MIFIFVLIVMVIILQGTVFFLMGSDFVLMFLTGKSSLGFAIRISVIFDFRNKESWNTV